MLAKIEKEIIEWITKTGGLMLKTESDYFICVFDQQYLNEFEKEKFNILDKVKVIEVDNQIQITISIAISADGQNNYEKYKSALSAMETDCRISTTCTARLFRPCGKAAFPASCCSLPFL